MAKWNAIVQILALHTVLAGGENTVAGRHTYCAFLDKQVAGPEDGKLLIVDQAQPGSDSEERDLIHNNTVERCKDDRHQCYAFWYLDPEATDSITLLKQGCWNNEPKQCERADCISDRALETKRISNITRWCCCLGDLCNANVTDVYVPGLLSEEEERDAASLLIHQTPIPQDPYYRVKAIITPLALVSGVSVLIVCIFALVRRHFAIRGGLELSDASGAPLSASQLMNMESGGGGGFYASSLDGLKLNTVINSGRYGEVWKGMLNDIPVAVKVLRASNRNLYVNERDILSLPLLDPKHIPVFYGAEEKVTLDGMPEYLLVSHYIDLGMLQHYLKNNILNWSQMCHILHSIAAALTHLHTEIRRGDKIKPAIAHRDINTRNILIKADLTCVLCDFGFAMKLDRHRTEDMGDQPTLSDVGTIRYMAPEVLDGAVNLRECEASLKQIDIYSLGLVFWEVGMRCSDLYQGLPVPEYMLPFQGDIGIHPTFEEMQDFVSREKRRPLFPDVWKSTNSAIRALKETIEDCWDQDGEARLTINCVEERVLEMAALWEARQKGVTPTVNPTATVGTVGLEGRKTEPCNLPPPPSSSTTTYHYPAPPTRTSVSSSEGSSYHRYSAMENSVSEATTETMLLSPDTITPSEPRTGSVNTVHTTTTNVNNPGYNNQSLNQSQSMNITAHNLMYYPKQSRQLAPHQGLNPTVARNTHKSSDEDMSIRGNRLVLGSRGGVRGESGSGGGSDDSTGPNGEGNVNAGSPLLTEALIDAIEENLVRNDLLHSSNTQNPQPNQNENQTDSSVTEPLTVYACPKQQNLPQPGSSPKLKNIFSRFRKQKPPGLNSTSSSSSSSSKFSLPFFSCSVSDKSAAAASGSCEENMDNLVEIRPGSGHFRTRSSEGELIRQQKSNLNRRPHSQAATANPPPLSTEVRMIGGTPTVQATSQQQQQHQRHNSGLEHPSTSSASDMSPPEDSPRRPSSLQLQGGHNYPRPIPPPSSNQNLYGGANNSSSGSGEPTAASRPVGQPIYNELPRQPGQPIYNELPPLLSTQLTQPVGQPIFNELPTQFLQQTQPTQPVGQPIFNELPALQDRNTYNPVNLSVNVIPGSHGIVNLNETGSGSGGAFSLGSDTGPPPNMDLPVELSAKKCNLQRANMYMDPGSAMNGTNRMNGMAPPPSVSIPPPPSVSVPSTSRAQQPPPSLSAQNTQPMASDDDSEEEV